MRLLVDTDAFCKLGVCGLLEEAVELLGARLDECGRLPALPYMLRRGRLRKMYGPEVCDSLLPIAEAVPPIAPSGHAWLDRLVGVPAIDIGEAQIFAAAAEGGLTIVAGDKRALRAVKEVHGLAEALAGRIVVLEAILLELCESLEPRELRQRVQPLIAFDTVVQVCFSASNPNAIDGLRSYYSDLSRDVRPLVLWQSTAGGDA